MSIGACSGISRRPQCVPFNPFSFSGCPGRHPTDRSISGLQRSRASVQRRTRRFGYGSGGSGSGGGLTGGTGTGSGGTGMGSEIGPDTVSVTWVVCERQPLFPVTTSV
jgi:hypothetical protein